MRFAAEPPRRRVASVALVAALSGAAMLPLAATSSASPTVPTATQAYAPPGLAEASGLTASVQHPGIVWIVEDSGQPIVRAYDAGGHQVGSVLFEESEVFGGDNRDTEALAMGPGPTLWSADIGDNKSERTTVLVHTTPELATLGDLTVTATSYRFTYPDGPRNAESFLVDPVDGRAYIATKSLGGQGGWYAAPATLEPGQTHELTRVQDLPGTLTDGAFSPDGTLVALRAVDLFSRGTLSEADVYEVVRHGAGEPVTLEERGEVELPEQEQGESLAFTPDGSALLAGSEGETEPIWSVQLPDDLRSGPRASDEPGSSGTPSSSAADSPPGSGPPAGQATPGAAGVTDATCGLSDLAVCASTATVQAAVLIAALCVLLAAIVMLRRR